MVAAPAGDREGCGPTLAGQPPIYNRLAGSEVSGRCQRPGAATPALDTEGEAFGDRDGVLPWVSLSCPEPWQRGLGLWP